MPHDAHDGCDGVVGSTIGKVPYKLEVTDLEDLNGDGRTDLTDVEELLRHGGVVTRLEGDGDFRSDECLTLLDEADIVITNPPFSLFRDFIATLEKHDKDFIVIGNQNAITYKEIFPLIRDNRLWLGYHCGDMSFMVPPDSVPRSTRYWVDQHHQKWRSLGNACWFTNLDIRKRHEPLDLYKRYSPADYPKYDNYDAINVDKVADIPRDYFESIGIPLAFLDRYDSSQFEIVGADFDLARTVNLGEKGRCPYYLVRGQEMAYVLVAGHSRQDVETMLHDRYGYRPDELTYLSGVMGVPITFLDKFCPEQFDIVGATESEGRGFSQGLWNRDSEVMQPMVNGSRRYKRIFITRLKYIK